MKAKRILGLILTFMLCMNITTAVFAEESTQKAITTADEVRAFMADLVVGASKNTNSRLGSISKGAYARIPGVDFGDGVYTSLEVTYGVSEAYAGGILYVYIDSMDTEPIAEIKLVATGDFGVLKPLSTNINLNISGVHSVWVEFGQAAMCDFFGLSFKGGGGSGSGAWEQTEVYDTYNKLTALGLTGLDDILTPDGVVTIKDVLAVAREIYPDFGMTDAEFCQKYNMTVGNNAKSTDIIKVFSAVAGYDRVEDADGAAFGNLGIFTGVKYTDGQMSGQEFIKCIDNFLDTEVLNIGPGRNEYSVSDETVLSACMDIYEARGVVQSDDHTRIVGGALPEDLVRIGNRDYYKNGLDINGFIGQNVNLYYKEDNHEYFLVYVESYKNTELLLTDEDDVRFENLRLSYTQSDSGKTKTVSVASDYVLIYNGLLISEFEETLFETFNGELKLIDNNSDGKYDCLIMTDTIDVFVTAVSRDTIYLKSNTPSKLSDKSYIHKMGNLSGSEDLGNYYINLEDEDFILKNVNGQKMSADSVDIIKKDNVLSIGYVEGVDGSELYTITISTKTVSGYVSTAYFDETAILEIDGARYAYSEFAEDDSKGLVGTDATLYLNARGKVVYTKKGAIDNNILFGYAEKYYPDNNEEKVYITIFGQNESIITYECAESVKIDGKKYKEYSGMSDALRTGFKKGIVTYTYDAEGKLSSIDFPYNYIGYKNSDKYTYEQENSLFLSYDGSDTSLRYKRDVRGFSGKTLDNDNTLVFFIPDKGKIEDYRVQPVSYLTHDTRYMAKAYGLDVNSYYSNVYEIKESADSKIKETAETYFVVSVNLDSTYDEDSGELYSSIEYYANGSKTRVMVDPEINDTIADLTCGDAIRIATNQKGIITKVDKRYDVETGDVSNSDDSSNEFHHHARVMEETVRTIDNGIAFLDPVEEIANLNTSNIVIYDSQVSGSRCLQPATVSDIVPGDKIFIAQYYGNVKGIMILR